MISFIINAIKPASARVFKKQRYPNLILPLPQYVSFYLNINMVSFVGFHIAVYAYVVLRIYVYIHFVTIVSYNIV